MDKVYYEQNTYVFNPLQSKQGWKEVKKVKPYLEVKVVKVKKEDKRCNEYKTLFCPNTDCKYFWDCEIASVIRKHNNKKEKPKGNWVNGENLDKIKFPCFCSYKIGSVKKLGQINNDFFKGHTQYTLNIIDRQVGVGETNSWIRYDSLKKLIKEYDIHILKGKIILFEEE